MIGAHLGQVAADQDRRAGRADGQRPAHARAEIAGALRGDRNTARPQPGTAAGAVRRHREAQMPAAVETFVAAPGAVGRAGYFAFALDDASPAARRLERIVAWRCRALGLPYGDQGLLIARGLYQAVGGFAALPLMEDVEFARRLGRRRLVPLDALAYASARRYRVGGYIRRPLRNLLCLALYFIGVPARHIARLYG